MAMALRGVQRLQFALKIPLTSIGVEEVHVA